MSNESLHDSADDLGIHPLLSVAVIAVDIMLYKSGLERTPIVDIGVAFCLLVATTLIQHNGMKDNLGLALGKGVVIAILTAIPTPLPSIVTATLGYKGRKQIIHNRTAQDG
jgi:hypothetical protein